MLIYDNVDLAEGHGCNDDLLHCSSWLKAIAAVLIFCRCDIVSAILCATQSNSCPACAVITNTVFPAVCLYYFWTASEALPMRIIMHTLVAVMLTTLAAKLLVEGVHTLPKYCKTRGTTTLGECPSVLSSMKASDILYALTHWNGFGLFEGCSVQHVFSSVKHMPSKLPYTCTDAMELAVL